MTRNLSLRLLFPSFALLVIAAYAADASEQAREDEPLIEEILIESVRERVTLNDTSHSIAVFTEEQLVRGTDREMDDLLQRVPNVTIDPFFGGIIMRGIAQGGISHNGFSGSGITVGQFVEGTYTPLDQHLWDASQVEVARGPESFLTAGLMGGATNVRYNEPGATPARRITASWVPESDEREIGLVYDAPINEAVGYRVAAHLRAADGTFNNVVRDDDAWNGRDQRMLRLQVGWDPDDRDTDVNLTFERIENRFNGHNGIVGSFDVDPFDRETFFNDATDHNETSTTARIEIRHRFDDRWSTIVRTYGIRLDRGGRGDCDATPMSFCQDRYESETDFAGMSARLFYEDGPWYAFFRQSALHLDVRNPFRRPSFPFDLDGPGPIPGVRVAVEFSNPTSDWWFVATQAGIRRTLGRLELMAALTRSGQTLDGAERSVRSYRLGSTGDPQTDATYDFVFENFLPQGEISEDLRDYHYLPMFIADYALTDALSVGAKYERTMRGGGVWFNIARGTVNTYDAELADSYDLFLRSTSLDGRLSVRVNAFHTEFKDQQIHVNLSSTPDDAQFVNAKRSHNEGIELETAWMEGDWHVWGSVGLLRAELDDFEFFDVDFSGNDFPNAPDWTVAAGFLYGGSLGPFAELDAALRPETRATIENVPTATNERRLLVNARVGWAFEQVEISMFVRNALDDEYLEHRERDQVGQVSVVGEPREIGATLTVSL